MSAIHHHDNVTTLRLEPGEKAIVEFCPDGANAHRGSSTLSFLVETIQLANTEMGLKISLPSNSTYCDHLGLYLIRAVCQPVEMSLHCLDGLLLKLRRFSMVLARGKDEEDNN